MRLLSVLITLSLICPLSFAATKEEIKEYQIKAEQGYMAAQYNLGIIQDRGL
tara:strand:+ start:157 stop:312 length:156 start_codon:yes stop_codon:yes gene_type:complete